MNKYLAAVIAAGFASTTALAGDDPDFATLDANGDGQLAQDEVSAHTKIAADFDTWDENGDGLIDETEYEAGSAADVEAVSDESMDPMWEDASDEGAVDDNADESAAEDDNLGDGVDE